MDLSPLLPKRQRLFHVPPSWVKSGEIFFITVCCAKRQANQLPQPEAFAVMTDALEYYIQSGKHWTDLFLVMPDQLHALLSFPPDQQMERVMRDWKRSVAKQGRIVWQDGFSDHRLRNNERYEEKAHYIRMNPVRVGLVAEPQDWPDVWEAGRA